MATTTDLTFLHFNDIVGLRHHLFNRPALLDLLYGFRYTAKLTLSQYHIDNPTLIARFFTKLRSWRVEHAAAKPLTIFSGDVFSPSLEASILRGDHMVMLLKGIGIDVGCFGNHGKLSTRIRPLGHSRFLRAQAKIL